MLVSGETEIRTSFGPMGRSKVVRNQVAGSLILTKDGQQLLQCYLSDPKLQDPLEKALITMCCGVAKEYGDGSMSALVIMSTISKSLNISVPSRNRLHILNAVEVIIHAVEMHKKLIAQYMIDHSVWHSTNSDDDLSKVQDHIRGLWGSILLPATNIATASNIIALLDRWIGLADNRLKVTGGKCRSILDNWDNDVIISLSGQPLGNSSCIPLDKIILEGRCRDFTALRSKNILNSVSETQFNRADNHSNDNLHMHRFVCLKRSILPVATSSLTELVTVKISSLSDLNSMGGSNLFAKTESFGVQKLVKWMTLSGVSVIFCSDSIDDDVVHLFASQGISMVDRVPSGSLGRLTQLTNSYLWDTSNDLLGNTEKGNIWGHFMGLERVTFGSQSNTYYRVAGLKQESTNGTDIHCDENCSPVTAESKSTLTDTYLMEANHIDVELNPPTMKGMSSESGTIHNNYDKSESSKLSSHRDTIAPQLILQCNSSLTSTLYCRLIQRCLLATVRISEESSLPNSSVGGISTSLQSVSTLPHSSSTQLDQPSHPRSSSTSSASSSSSNNTPSVVWVPGAGAAEMGWSALWGVMSQKITTRLHSEIAGLNYVSSQTKIVPKEMPGRITFLEILDPLADILIDSILHRIKQKYHFIHLKTLSADKLCKESPVNRGCNPQYARAVQHFIEFSTLLSHAYAEIPKLLLLNASSGVDGTHRISKNAENIWSHWKDHYMTNPTECNANPLIDISKSDSKIDPLCCSGRLGLVCPFGPKGIHLESFYQDPLCVLQDVIPARTSSAISTSKRASSTEDEIQNNTDLGSNHGIYPVITSLSQFFRVFSVVMEGSRLMLRIGGNSGIINVKRLSVKGRNRNLIRQSSGTINTSRNRSSSMTDSSDSESDTRSEEEYLEN